MLRSTVVRVDHLCCGMEAKLIRDMLGPLEAVAEVKISITDRRVNVEHTDGLAPESIVDMLNRKHLGASLQDKSVVESVGSSFNHAEIVRLTVNATQIVLFAATLTLPRVGFPKMAYGLAWACVAMSVALFHEAYLALRRRSPNVELMMAIAVVGALVRGQRGRDIAEIQPRLTEIRRAGTGQRGRGRLGRRAGHADGLSQGLRARGGRSAAARLRRL